MSEKNPQEKAASERQAQLMIEALEKAKMNGGTWLNEMSKTFPKIFLKEGIVSPFNALIMALHSDQQGYMTNEYTLFNDAKKRGEAVQSNEKGIPFYWYNWSEYVNKHNAEDKINKEDYLTLSPEEQKMYKGVRAREVRTLFNIDQTTLPFVDKTTYDKEVKSNGIAEERINDHEKAQRNLRLSVNQFLLNAKENLVPIHKDGTGYAHYDGKNDIIHLPESDSYEEYNDYACEVVRQVVSATGHPQRLSREGFDLGNNQKSSDDAMKQERLITEIATGVKLLELGIPAKLSSDSMDMVDFWQRELKENPSLIDIIESDLNNAINLIHKAERGEKIESVQEQKKNESEQLKSQAPKHYYIAEEIKGIPNKDTKEMVIVKDVTGKNADVVMPAGASLEVNNEIPGMSKQRTEHALRKEGFENIRFYNTDGALGYRPDDRYFQGKEVAVVKLNNWKLEEKAQLDVTDAVKRANDISFTSILMLRDDEGKWALYMKPENSKSFAIYPDREDINLYFTSMKQGNSEYMDTLRHDLANKYYQMAQVHPELKQDLFKCKDPDIDISLIEKVVIFKTKETEKEKSKILCSPTITGMEKQKAREVTPDQWRRMWIAEDMKDYKIQLAATLFSDVLKKSKEKSMEHGQGQETKDPIVNDNSPEEMEKQEIRPILKQYQELKKKHPDAVLLFRCGDFYQTYSKDAEVASKTLGITLTQSSRTKDLEGKPLSMAGFPYHALDSYLPKLVRSGVRVAICDQLTSPSQRNTNGEQQSQVKEKDTKESEDVRRSIHL